MLAIFDSDLRVYFVVLSAGNSKLSNNSRSQGLNRLLLDF